MKTESLVTKIQEISHDILVISDSEWISSNGGRCITDYRREIEFSRKLSEEELEVIRNILKDNECPGWTGVSGYLNRDTDKNIYRFSTCWDSSD